MQSIGIIKTVLMMETGKLIKSKSMEVNVYDFLYSFIQFFSIYEDARKLDQEIPCFSNRAVKPV